MLGWSIVILIIVMGVVALFNAPNPRAEDANGFSASDKVKHGKSNPQMICPHCQVKGRVLTKAIQKNAGVSGAKATGALLTGGVSLLATGLSRKDSLIEAFCKNCSSTWNF
jgi:hypothetical protein